MGARSRRKGKRGEAAVARLLGDRDWTVDRTRSGVGTDDMVAMDPHGRAWSVEVKNAMVWRWKAWLTQARTQARRRGLPWALFLKIPSTRSWLVLRQGERPAVWHEKTEETSW